MITNGIKCLNKLVNGVFAPFFYIKKSFLQNINIARIFASITVYGKECVMKETGIVRRIDELGRVVIPKEIRKTMRIKEGDPLEIFTDRETLMLKKYSPITAVEDIIKTVAESLYSVTEMNVVISNTDSIVAVKGKQAKELSDKSISPELIRLIGERRTVVFDGFEESVSLTTDGDRFKKQIIVPVICEGDALGAVILGDDREGAIDVGFIKLAMLSADFIARQF